MLDVTMLARWIEGDPPLRVRLWMAEDDRGRLASVTGYERYAKRRGQRPEVLFTAEQSKQMREEIEAARRAGLAAGVPLKSAGSVLPTGEQMAQDVDNLWELYNIGYRTLSPLSHADARSFSSDKFVKRRDGIHLEHEPPFDEVALRALAVTTVCMLLATVSRQTGLGIESAADKIRLAMVFPDHPPV